MKTSMIFAVAVAIGLLASCNKPAEQNATAFDLEKAKSAIAELHQKFSDAISKSDSVGYASIYHSQAVVFAPNMEPLIGREKLTAFAGMNFRMGVSSVPLQATEFWGDQDAMIVSGTYEVKGKDGTVWDKGKFLEIWKDDNGEWKIYRDMWNTSNPMPPAPVTKK
jgi:ketosteroid isomerase-like protein